LGRGDGTERGPQLLFAEAFGDAIGIDLFPTVEVAMGMFGLFTRVDVEALAKVQCLRSSVSASQRWSRPCERG